MRRRSVPATLTLAAALAAVVAAADPAGAQTPLQPTGRGEAALPCRTPGRLISANATSVVSIYSPSQATRPPSRLTGFYACTRGHAFRRLGADPVSAIFGEGDALVDPALAGRFVGLTTQRCSRVGCFGGVVRSVSLSTGKVAAAPFPSDQSTASTFITRRGVVVFSCRTFTPADGAGDRTATGGAVWRLGRDGVLTRVAAAAGLDPAALQLDDVRASWLADGVAQTAPIG